MQMKLFFSGVVLATLCAACGFMPVPQSDEQGDQDKQVSDKRMSLEAIAKQRSNDKKTCIPHPNRDDMLICKTKYTFQAD